MVVAACVAVGLAKAGVSVAGLFLAAGLINALVAIYLYRLVPEFFLRFLAWLAVHSIYRLKKVDLHHIPPAGPALLVCNHVSYADALILMAACPRPVRFVMEYDIYRLPVVKQLCRAAGVIPIAPARQNVAVLKQAFEDIHKALASGDLVAIFPEGRITENGEIQPFQNGLKRILSAQAVPVVPLALRGLWGSFFSRKYGRAMSRPFIRGFLSPIEVLAGEPVAAEEATPEHLQEKVAKLRGEKL
jgi:1-acyl-sn-glycerol-3-phosphate acyltransferase